MRLAIVLLAACLPLLASGAERKPNILFLLVDDMGWADVGCYGSTFYETPHIDQLARDGIRFTDAYTSASICSPTRGSIMTGRHPVRIDITDFIPGAGDQGKKLKTPEDTHHLKLEEVTIAEALKEGEYATFYTGKWHLGGKEFGPDKQGFDVYYDPHSDSSRGSPGKSRTMVRKHATQELTRETMKFIVDHKDQPWFAYLAYYDIHTPIVAEPEFIDHYKTKASKLGPSPEPIREHEGLSRPRQDNPELASMVQTVDRSVAKLMKHLDDLGLADNTLVIFYSDNGGLATKSKPGPGCNLPLRASKGWLYEGGIRVPLIVRMPGKQEAGTVTPYLVNSPDMFPTILSLAGLEPRPDDHVDGEDFSPILQGAMIKRAPRSLYWHYPHYHGSTWTPGAAIRHGDWKLVEFYHDGGHELYDLRNDIGEQKNVAGENPDTVKDLLAKLHAWQKEMGAKMPIEN